MVDHHGRFVWYELITTDTAARQGLLHQSRGLGRADASTSDLAYTLFTCRKGPGRRAHGPAGGGEENGRDAEVDGVCRVDDVGRHCRPDQASWRSRVRPSDQQQYRPDFDCR